MKADRLHIGPLTGFFFLSLIRSRLVVIDLTATALPPLVIISYLVFRGGGEEAEAVGEGATVLMSVINCSPGS